MRLRIVVTIAVLVAVLMMMLASSCMATAARETLVKRLEGDINPQQESNGADQEFTDDNNNNNDHHKIPPKDYDKPGSGQRITTANEGNHRYIPRPEYAPPAAQGGNA